MAAPVAPPTIAPTAAPRPPPNAPPTIAPAAPPRIAPPTGSCAAASCTGAATAIANKARTPNDRYILAPLECVEILSLHADAAEERRVGLAVTGGRVMTHHDVPLALNRVVPNRSPLATRLLRMWRRD